MKAVKFSLAGRERYLAFTVEAMFQIQEQFGGLEELVGLIGENSREGVSAACKAAAILSEKGELCRRSLGYDPEPIVDTAAIAATLAPADVAGLDMAIISAVSLGFGREVEADNEVDLFLAEINAQKKTR